MDVIGTPDRPDRRGGARWTVASRGRTALRLAGLGLAVVAVSALVVRTGSAPPSTEPRATGETGAAPSPGTPSRAPVVPPPAPDRRPPDLGIRGTGGTVTVVGAGVEGTLSVEVRNAGRPVRLAGVTAQVPGVRFEPRVPPNGATLPTDGLIGLRLGYVVQDCALVEQAGRILLTVLEPDGTLEIVLPVFDEQGERRQSALDRVLAACPP